MNTANNSSEAAEPIWLMVAQLSAGFHRMEYLSRELIELDGIRQDIAGMQAMVRRDVANAVLKTAIELKKSQSELVVDDTPASPTDLPKHDAVPQSDEWANRLVRWADQFGRDLFKLPSLLAKKPKDDGADSADRPE